MKIGQRIKRLRIANDLTQDELAQRADLTKGFISQLERDLTSISIEALSQILEVLGIPLSEFFKVMELGEQKIVFGEKDRVVLEGDHDEETIELLIPGAQKNLMDPVLVTIEPGKASIDSGHEGEEFGMLLSGTVQLRMEGSKTVHRVRKGESFYFKSDRPHTIENLGKRTATILWVVSPPVFH
ncbi:MAG: cupin domain-containing protein [bacterium]|nr:cupin domain-containing protein [bacterium]MDT8395245.1 cupin domain-containing protein [bacterium]